MSFTTKAVFFRGFDRDTHRWKVVIESATKLNEKDWEQFLRDLDKFLSEKYPGLRMTGHDKPGGKD